MRFLLISFFALSMLFFTACNSSKTPAEVSETFLTALADGDQKTAREYATLHTIKLLDVASTFGTVPVRKDFTFKLVSEKIEGTKAIVSYKELDQSIQTLHLVKKDDGWKVDETKK